MEKFRLKNFLDSMQEWPAQDAVLESTLQNILQFLPLGLIIFWISGEHSCMASRDQPSQKISPSLLSWIEKIKNTQSNQTFIMQITKEEIQTLQLPKSASHLMGAHASNLVILRGTQRNNQHQMGSPLECWIFILTGLPPSQEDEACFELIAHALSCLAFMKHQKSEIILRDQFLSIASHELKTPLTSIYGILQLQERMQRPVNGVFPPYESQKQYSFLKIVLGQIERMNELIEGLLDVSRIQNGRFKIEPTDTDICPIIKEVVEYRLSFAAQEAGIRIQTQIPTSLKTSVDPGRFEEVVSNLGMNALRFSPEGGTIRISLLERPDSFTLRVRDQGPALTEEEQKRIFKIYELTNRSARLGGLGLGLFISKQIALLHGGDVSVTESTPGKGNVIEARFPSTKKIR